MKKRPPTPEQPEEAATSSPPPSRVPFWIVTGIALAVLAAGGAVLADWWIAIPDEVVATYVGRNKCAQCHQSQVHQWTGSHHDLAMDLATPATVLGDFNDASLEHEGMRSRMFKRDGKYFVNTEGPDGQKADFEVKYTFGVTPLQQYMVEFDRPKDLKENEVPRLQVLRISWDTVQNQWFYLPAPDVPEKLLPGDPLHWTGIMQRWNTTCADCHSTNVHRNFDEQSLTYKTTFSEIDVSCETCHGPGSVHVQLAGAHSLFWDRKRGYGLANLKSKDSDVEIHTCAKCHSLRRQVLSSESRGGDNYYDHYANQLLEHHAYYCDGQILGEVYELGSFTQSKMYHKNIRCSDCHDPHTLKPKHEGNKLCTSCHQHPAGKYDTPGHHHHKTEGTGGLCIDCHMPQRTYMEVDPRRDHSLRVPRPDLSVELGVPNACTQCHLDLGKLPAEKRAKLKDYAGCLLASEQGDADAKAELDRLNRWAAEKTKEWYPRPVVEKEPVLPSPAPAIAAAWAGKGDAEKLRKLAKTAGYPAIFRATALELLRTDEDEKSVAVAKAELDDPSPVVRAEAIEVCGRQIERLRGVVRTLEQRAEEYQVALQHIQQQGQLTGAQAQAAAEQSQALQQELAARQGDLARLVDAVAERLSDPVRWPRIMAARQLLSVGRLLTPDQLKAREQALEDYRAGLLTDNDRALAHVMLGQLEEQLGHADLALLRYKLGMRVEPQVVGPRTHLANLLDQLADNQRRFGQPDAVKRLTDEARNYRQEELILWQRDLRLLPATAPKIDRAGVLYQVALTATLVGDYKAAESYLKEAIAVSPEPTELLFTLALLYEQKLNDREKAIDILEDLRRLQPENRAIPQYLRSLRTGGKVPSGPEQLPKPPF